MIFYYYFRKCTLLIPAPPSTPSTTPTTTVTTTPTTTTPEVCSVDCFDCPMGMQTCQLVPGTRCSFKCMSKTPEICTNDCLDCGYNRESCQLIPFTQCSFKCIRNAPEEMCPTYESNKCGADMKCWDKPGTSCQLVPGTRCNVTCMRTFRPPTTLPTPATTTPEGPIICTDDCLRDSDCEPGYSCQSVPGPECALKCMKTPKLLPTPAPPAMMRIEMCILPGNHGRSSGRPLANLGFEVVVVQCRPNETCVESDDSKILGNPLG